MKNGEGCLKTRVLQVWVKSRELRCGEQAFVDNRAVRERDDVKPVLFRFREAVFYLLTDEIEQLFKGVIGEMPRSSDENLLDIGECLQRFFADSVDVHGDFAPSEEGCAVFL